MNTYRRRVLLVDDHEQIREALRKLLVACEDVEVVAEARDGEEAIMKVASCQPDIILMDINMPRMNGIQATMVIKKTRKDVAIIGLCTVIDTYTAEEFLKAGGFAVLPKTRFDDLYSTIQRACATRASTSTAQP